MQQTRIRQIEEQARRCAAIGHLQREPPMDQSFCNRRTLNNGSVDSNIPGTPVTKSTVSVQVCSDTVTTTQCEPPIVGDYPPAPYTHSVTNQRLPPCKLLSRLAENPAADITQVARVTSEENHVPNNAEQEGGVACSKAYEMLMRYATSDERIDYIAQALEAGCSANGKGECSVKSDVVLQALDGICG
jgi:hypothetical protein